MDLEELLNIQELVNFALNETAEKQVISAIDIFRKLLTLHWF